MSVKALSTLKTLAIIVKDFSVYVYVSLVSLHFLSHLSLSTVSTSPTVLSPAPPLFVDSSVSLTTVEGHDVTLPCATFPDPSLSFTWFFDDIQISLPSDEEGGPVLLTNGSLHLSSVRDSLEGEYTCEARNNLGTAEGTVHLTVFGEEELGKLLGSLNPGSERIKNQLINPLGTVLTTSVF